MWYESTPTIMSSGGVTTYINCNDTHFPKDADSKAWIDRATARGEYPSIVYRAAVAKMLEGVDAKLVTDAKLAAATTDVAPPTTGTAAAKEAAVQVKLATVVPVAEYDKLAALAATVVKAETAMEEPLADLKG